MAELSTDIRETVRERYAAAARSAAAGDFTSARAAECEPACCSPASPTFSPADAANAADAAGLYGSALYDAATRAGVPEAALNVSLGCGVPTAVADLQEGETVLDLGSGAGADVLISARRVGPDGKAIGLDMTDDATRADIAAWTGCVAGALTEAEFRHLLEAAGLDGVEITPTHKVHEHASSAIIRARKPSSCCPPETQASCCEPSAKAECCSSEQHGAGARGCKGPAAEAVRW